MEARCVIHAPPAAVDHCRRCGSKGRPVSRKTMQSLLLPEAVVRLEDGPYHFDASPDCDVVYFSNQTDSYFDKNALAVRVGIKEKEPPVPICYCFGHTADSAREEIVRTGRSTVAQRITQEIRAGRCACEVKNPSGSCCLGEVNRVVGRIRTELERELTQRR
jgi:hypothetical protein